MHLWGGWTYSNVKIQKTKYNLFVGRLEEKIIQIVS
jgi:hypothetical protein